MTSQKRLKSAIIYEDDSLVALNKASGILAIPDRFDKDVPSLLDQLRRKYQDILAVHRLDKDTSGIIIFAKDADSHRFLNSQFQNRKVVKKYWALVNGQPLEDQGKITASIGSHPTKKGIMCVHKNGKKALTHYQIIEKIGPFSELEVLIETGRTHQIRVHLQYIQHPLAYDPIYGGKEPILLSKFKKKYNENRTQIERPLLSRLSLHAKQLIIQHPRLDKELDLQAPLSKDLQVCVKQLKKYIH